MTVKVLGWKVTWGGMELHLVERLWKVSLKK